MRRICANNSEERELTTEGFVVTNFLNPAEFAALQIKMRELGFGRQRASTDDRLQMSVMQGDAQSRRELHDRLLSLVEEPVKRALINYRVARIAVFDKLPQSRGVRVHQHTSLVDENKCRSITAWIPLCATNEMMGTLCVVPRSHHFTNHIRSYDDFADAFATVSPSVIARYSDCLDLAECQAVLFDDRLIHWSGPNNSDVARTAIQLELIPAEAELVVHYRKNDFELDAFYMDEITYQTSSMTASRPETLVLKQTALEERYAYTDEEFIDLAEAAR